MYQRQPDFEADLDQARDASTDEETLQALLGKHYGEVDIAEAIARNPSCPYRLFTWLWKYMGTVAEENPSFHKYQANAHWHRDVSNGAIRHFSRWSSNISKAQPAAYKVRFILEQGNGEYQRYVMALEQIPESFVRAGVASKSAPLRKVIAAKTDLPPDIYEKLAQDSAKSVRLILATNPNTPASALTILARDKVSEVAKQAQAHPNCPDEAIHQARIAESKCVELSNSPVQSLTFSQLCKIAYNEQTDANTLVELAEHSDPCIRVLVGLNKTSPPSILAALAEDKMDWVRSGPAFNPITPSVSLEKLLAGKSPDVQIGLASNPALSEIEQIKLAALATNSAAYALANNTQHDSVREKLVEDLPPAKSAKSKTWRHHLQDALDGRKTGKFANLQKGKDSRHLFVSKIAAKSEKCPDNLAAHYAYYCFEDYSQNPKAALALLEGKAHVRPEPYKDWKVDMWLTDREAPGFVGRFFLKLDDSKRRSQAASSWTTQVVDLLPFVLDTDTNTRKRVAERPDIIQFMLELLARDEKPGVREQISKNKKTPKSILELMASDKATTVRVQASKRATKNNEQNGSDTPVANQGAATERSRLARNTQDTKLLTDLARDRATSVRINVAQNRGTPEEVLIQLAYDKEEKIRAIVARRVDAYEVRVRLLGDSHKTVRIEATKNRNWYTYDKSNPSDYRRRYDENFLQRISKAEDDELRALVAEHTEDEGVMHYYMQDAPIVTRALTKNKRLTEKNKLSLAKATADQDTLAILARRTKNEELFLIAARKITSSHADDPIRCHSEMLSRPHIQDELCTHPLVSVRSAIAHSSSLSDWARKKLSEDENATIRRAMGRD